MRERGASGLSYVAVAVIAALLVSGVALALTPASVSASLGSAVCQILQLPGCADAGGTPDDHEQTPYERATAGSAWFGGDSFASGEGIFSYDPATDTTTKTAPNECHRSGSSYQAQVFALARQRGAFASQDYASEACSGAIVSDLYSDNHLDNAGEGPQMYASPQPADASAPFDNVPEDASLITLSLGGKDVGFADVVKACITEGLAGSGCEDTDALRSRFQSVYGTRDQPGTLEQQLAKLRAEHPDARIILVGYPEMFAEQRDLKKGFFTTMSLEEQRWANEMARELNTAGSDMAERLGVEWVDPTSAYVGEGYDHRAGSSDPWINDLVGWGDSESFHPNQGGHDATAGLVWEQILTGGR